MKTDDIFYQIFQTAPELAFELMGQLPPCEYEFRAQEVKARELLQRVQQELSDPLDQNNFVELVLETVTRIFPQQSKEEIRKMLELVPVNQTRFYREIQEEEARSLVLRLLKRRLGELPNQAQAQIEQLNLAQTETLAEDLLDFTTLDDLLTWLQQQFSAES